MTTKGDFSWEGEGSNGMRLRAAEMARAVAHWTAFYDDELSASASALARAFAEWLGEPPAPEQSAPQTPQGGLAN